MKNGLGRFVVRRREQLGISAKKLAEMTGMPLAYLSQIESGNRKWPQKYIRALARSLQVPETALALFAGKISFPDDAFRKIREELAASEKFSPEALERLGSSSLEETLDLLLTVGADLSSLELEHLAPLDTAIAVQRIIDKAKRVEWNDERAATVESIMDQWISIDRTKKE